MEPSLAEYRKFAEECRKLAQLAKTAEEKKVLQEMEAAWSSHVAVSGERFRNAANCLQL